MVDIIRKNIVPPTDCDQKCRDCENKESCEYWKLLNYNDGKNLLLKALMKSEVK